jgi:phosphatidylserine/phosphatidylglycerophosphate/cardiolipin synthase-like enzyme
MIYVETQYFSSRRLREALKTRMRSAGRRLEIVVVVNERAEAVKEEIAVGLRQAESLQELRDVARATGHSLGLYYSVCQGSTEEFRATYIHSKIMIVDDRFLTVGSANFTNRSLGLDSELHVSWEAGAADDRLGRAIRRLRVSLLAEHAGISGVASVLAPGSWNRTNRSTKRVRPGRPRSPPESRASAGGSGASALGPATT